MVIIEEAWPMASLSSEIAFNVQRDAFDFLDAPVKRVCTADVPMAYAPNLVEEFMPKLSKIIEEVKSVMYRK
jgi:pyruvate dehydrogenase E1 component beta subunit